MSREPSEPRTPPNGGDGGARAPAASNFIRDIIDDDLRSGRRDHVATRFPPEPNGYLHIGHAKAICLDFGLARDYGGTCNLRFDDTNPVKEEEEYVRSIQEDVRWLGFEWSGEVRFASDYFERLYEFAVELIRAGKAYVCSLSDEEIRDYRGSLGVAGRPSPYRDRPVEENLDLLRRMRAGEFADGAHVLRAKIDMAASNMKMRDPLLYRIRHAHHHRTGDAWSIYPFYDFAHPLSDAIEGITHSICTLEFENNRELYDWFIDNVDAPAKPQQIEFARLALDYTLLSKRKLLRLVKEGYVSGWDDPRMPTIAAMRRRGYTPEAIRAFCDMIGVAKNNSTVDIGKLEYCLRDDLNRRAPRVMCVLRPLKVVITNYPADKLEEVDAPHFPPDVGKPGSRPVPFSRELYIERDDFAETPPKGYKRLSPGRVVRLRYAYNIRCDEVVTDPATGEVSELRCTCDPDTLGGGKGSLGKPGGVIHWVSASRGVPAEVRLYDRLFSAPKPDDVGEGGDFTDNLNPRSLVTLTGAVVEPSMASARAGTHVQFERQGYFFTDPIDSRPGGLVFNRVVTLQDSWAKAKAQQATARTPAPADETAAAAASKGKSKARPQRKSRAEVRAQARAESQVLGARYDRYRRELGLPDDTADLLTGEAATSELFEQALAACANASAVANWIVNELPRELKGRSAGELPMTGRDLGALVDLIERGEVSAGLAREVLAHMAAHGGDPRQIIAERGLEQISDRGAIAPVVDDVLARFPDKVTAYAAGKTGLLGFFVGQVIKASGGAASPQIVRELVESRLPDPSHG